MYKIMIYINTYSGDKWFYYQENEKDYVARSLHEIKETVLTLIDTYGKDNIKIVKQVTGEDMEGSVETFIYDSTDNYEELVNRPSINGVEIIGALSLAELGIQPAGDYAANAKVSELEQVINNIDLSPYATNTRVDQVEYKVDNIDLTSYATNERVEQVEAKVDAIDLEPYATIDYLDEVVAGIDFSASDENITGVKTFSVLPRSAVVPTSEDELTNKSYVDHGVENCASKEYVDSLLANINTGVVQQLAEEVVIINDYESGIYQPVYNGAKVRLYNESRTAYTEPTNMTNSLLIWDKEKRTFLALFQGSISLYSYYGTTSESYSFGDKVMFTFKEQEINGKKTFTTLPETTITPTNDRQFINKLYVDNLINSLDTGIQKLSANKTGHLPDGVYIVTKSGGVTINAATNTSVTYKYGTMVFKAGINDGSQHWHVYMAMDYDKGPQLRIDYVAASSYRFTTKYLKFNDIADKSYVDTAIANAITTVLEGEY